MGVLSLKVAWHPISAACLAENHSDNHDSKIPYSTIMLDEITVFYGYKKSTCMTHAQNSVRSGFLSVKSAILFYSYSGTDIENKKTILNSFLRWSLVEGRWPTFEWPQDFDNLLAWLRNVMGGSDLPWQMALSMRIAIVQSVLRLLGLQPANRWDTALGEKFSLVWWETAARSEVFFRSHEISHAGSRMIYAVDYGNTFLLSPFCLEYYYISNN